MHGLVDETVSSFLEGSRKLVYLGYRRFLVEGHRYRSKKFYTFFDGNAELHSAPAKRYGHYIFKMVRTIQVSYGKVTKDGKKKKEIRRQSKVYHSRNSPSSTSTYLIWVILKSAMQSMVCT